MIFAITHTTHYRYDNRVFLDPQTIRLKPKTDDMQQLLEFHMEVDPHPAGTTDCRDMDGNMERVLWFDTITDHLKITVKSKTVTLCDNPFNYILPANALQLPYVEEKIYRQSIKPYLGDGVDREVVSFAQHIAKEVEMDTLGFLNLLNQKIHDHCEVVVREEGEPLAPAKTLAEEKGACRDLACLFIACCRSLGIGSRFVSGYHLGDEDSESHLHAWAEVYLPGAGWRGYDPTAGLAVADQHVYLAAGPRADSAAPVSGTYRGEGGSRLETTIEMDVTP